MNVIIACLNSKYIHMSTAPWCLAAGVAAFAETAPVCRVMESTINADILAFAADIANERPDVVSFCCYIWNISQSLQAARAVKAATGCSVVLGGPEVAYRATEVLEQYDFIDHVLSGEGEFAFPRYLDMLGGRLLPSQVAGLTYRAEDGIRSNPEAHYHQTPPSPFTEEYFSALKGRICYIESSRGCPYCCAFCLSGRLAGLRFFDMATTKRDLLKLAASGTRTIKFVDRTFNANAAHAEEILTFILEHYGKDIPTGVCFHFEIAGDILKESTLAILERMPMGAVQLEIGMQSFNEDTLAALHRKTDTRRLRDNIRKLVSFGNMHIHIDLIAGLTGEDMASFERSFDIGFSLGAHMLQMGFLKLLYGAEMREEKDKYPCTFNTEPPYEVTSTPWLRPDELAALKQTEDALERLYNSGRFLLTIAYLLENGYTPFRLFYEIGTHIDGRGSALGEYALALYRYFENKVDGALLREKLITDLYCSGSAVQLPPALRPIDPRHKQAKALLGKGHTKVALLPRQGKILWVDYDGEPDTWGRLPARFYDIEILNKDEVRLS